MSSVSPGGQIWSQLHLIGLPGLDVTTHFDLVSGPFHSPILSGCIVYQPLLTCTIFIRAPANYRVVHLVIFSRFELIRLFVCLQQGLAVRWLESLPCMHFDSSRESA